MSKRETIITEEVLTSGVLYLGTGNLNFPCSITLKSTSGSKEIALSTDNGLEYFLPTIDITTASMLVLSINSPVTNIRITGTIGDTVISCSQA